MLFDKENWTEIFSAIKKNKLRTFFTGFSISWGIFMFCILLSAGNGLRNGMSGNFEGRSNNSVEYWGRQTSTPYKGLPKRRAINIDEKDIRLIRNQIPAAENPTSVLNNSFDVSYNTLNCQSNVIGVEPEYADIQKVKIIGAGRFINGMDIRESRRVAVINQQLHEALFADDDPVGKNILIGKLNYIVVGVFKEQQWGDEKKAYIPFSTAQRLYHRNIGADRILFTLNSVSNTEESDAFEKDFRHKMSVLHHFDPDDERAIGLWNMLENYLQFLGIFNGLSAFIWIIGAGTLIAGIIGVSNIMLITVRERTKEIGIRKALGATPTAILGNILMESTFITSVFGYIGMFLGVGLGELVSSILENPALEEAVRMFRDPVIEVPVALGAMLVLILSGLIAGYFPAWKAVKISPVEAMRYE
ncbi:MAG: ABC transporter permease [Candidatus Symbiothrix sp.]|jgi:putative ABC transport system permease protein|nr:ABC transporter permease [Candidatus Symbiothrix sp.]